MDLSYFTRKPQEFYRYRDLLQAIERYLVKTAQKKPLIWDTLNERSFQLTGDEKFLDSAEGVGLLRRIQVSHAESTLLPGVGTIFLPFTGWRDRAGKVNKRTRYRE